MQTSYITSSPSYCATERTVPSMPMFCLIIRITCVKSKLIALKHFRQFLLFICSKHIWSEFLFMGLDVTPFNMPEPPVSEELQGARESIPDQAAIMCQICFEELQLTINCDNKADGLAVCLMWKHCYQRSNQVKNLHFIWTSIPILIWIGEQYANLLE